MIYNFQTDSILGSYSIPGIYFSLLNMFTWMKEERDKTLSGGAYLRCPVSTSVHFSLRNEGYSEYIRVCEGRESLSSNF